MSVDSILDGALTTLLEKAQRRVLPSAPRTATINFQWSGGGSALTLTTVDPILVEVPFPSRIVWAHLYAGDGAGLPVAITATVDIGLTKLLTFGGSVPLYGSGAVPALTAAASADLLLTGWQIDLDTGDTLVARILTFTGAATWVTLALQVRAVDSLIGEQPIVDSLAADYVDASGATYVIR